MSMVAAQYADEGERSKVMGFVLGSIALGVLVGYPIGSILYDIEGKMAPFLLISSLILIPLTVLAMALVGISVILLPTASTMGQLVIPHLGMGLGIGIADAALVPLLASLVDQDGNYGPVYSIQQVAVSLAYSLGPIVGSELVRMIGFQWVMRIVGLINLAYCPLLIYLAITRKHTLLGQDVKEYSSINKTSHDYERFQDDDDL
ncbi:GSCOCG00009594001-RA-CDS [Cotesia congregata]|nr:GSCOCG00009594001-RA-CDS [Cotesia congregata]